MENKSFSDRRQLAVQLKIEGRAFIDGAYCDAASARSFDCVSPVDGKVLAAIADCGEADVDAAEGGDMNFPFGGYRQLGNGRDKSLHALEKYTELKSTLVRLR